jgi:membrane protein YqaA with SNARE-associated domain
LTAKVGQAYIAACFSDFFCGMNFMAFLVWVIKMPSRFLRRLYDWTIAWSQTTSAAWALFFIAFMESSFFPIPPDVLLIAMTLGAPGRWWRYAAICTLGSVLGGIFGYFLGWAFYETLGKLIVEVYGFQEEMTYIGHQYAQNAFLAILTAAFTPIPYKVITLAAGLFQISLLTLIVASLVGRAGRFFLVAALLRLAGGRAKDFIDKYFNWLTLIFMLMLLGGFWLLSAGWE